MMIRSNIYWLATALLVAVSLNQATGFTTPQQQVSIQRHGFSQFTTGPQKPTRKADNTFWRVQMSSDSNEKENNLPFFLDPGTKGGAMFLSLVAFVVPVLFYQFVTNVFGLDGIEAGKWIGGGFTVFACVGWISTYLFRVATKDMTYAQQLKDYENAVIQKRLEELDEDEIQALVEEVERDDF